MEINIFEHRIITPLSFLGLTDPFWSLNIDTLFYTWAGMLCVFTSVFLFNKYAARRKENTLTFALEYAMETLATLCSDTIGYFRADYFIMLGTFFCFTIALCLVGLLPFLDEATKDPNTTFAISLLSFVYVAYKKVQQEGFIAYLAEFLGNEELPLLVRILMMPLEVIGHISRILSMGFRLFGNVLGGSMIIMMIINLFSLGKILVMGVLAITGIILYLFRNAQSVHQSMWYKVLNLIHNILLLPVWGQIVLGIAESAIQSFIIIMLTLVYLSMSIHHDLKHDPKGIKW